MSAISSAYAASLIPNAIVLLSQGRLANLGDRFRNGGGNFDWLTMLIVVVVMAIAIAVVWLVSQHLNKRETGGYHNHRSLYRELCRAHQLGWRDRRLLALLAHKQGVVVPARLFVEPERFEPPRLEGLKESQQTRLAGLREYLFGEAASPIR